MSRFPDAVVNKSFADIRSGNAGLNDAKPFAQGAIDMLDAFRKRIDALEKASEAMRKRIEAIETKWPT